MRIKCLAQGYYCRCQPWAAEAWDGQWSWRRTMKLEGHIIVYKQWVPPPPPPPTSLSALSVPPAMLPADLTGDLTVETLWSYPLSHNSYLPFHLPHWQPAPPGGGVVLPSPRTSRGCGAGPQAFEGRGHHHWGQCSWLQPSCRDPHSTQPHLKHKSNSRILKTSKAMTMFTLVIMMDNFYQDDI